MSWLKKMILGSITLGVGVVIGVSGPDIINEIEPPGRWTLPESFEGVHVGKEAVLGANVVLTASTKIIDVTQEEPKTYTGKVPPRSVVIPGSYIKRFPAGDYQVPCALIIGERKESTDKKISLNEALRTHNVAV